MFGMEDDKMSIKLPINHSEEIKCTKCFKKSAQTIKIEDFTSEESYERGMGEEVQHSFEVQVTCPYCGKDFDVSGDVWEYPVDKINLIQVEK